MFPKISAKNIFLRIIEGVKDSSERQKITSDRRCNYHNYEIKIHSLLEPWNPRILEPLVIKFLLLFRLLIEELDFYFLSCLDHFFLFGEDS